jgi:protein-S-isoprenylcysteine O-methyltransferase Ste14
VDKPKRILPPVYFLTAILSMAALHFLLPIARILPAGYSSGGVLILIGMSLILWAVRLFFKAGTAIKPFAASTKMIVAGPYRWSRNPIYLGMVFILVGIGLALGTLAPFVIVPIFVWLIQKNIIAHEEAMLDKSFGAAYAEYKKRIRRWL